MRTSADGRADLHVHTACSDGAQRPEAIVDAAQGRLDIVAITDHDEIRGALRARAYALAHPELGVDVVVSEEISTIGPGPSARCRSISPCNCEPATDSSVVNASTWQLCRDESHVLRADEARPSLRRPT